MKFKRYKTILKRKYQFQLSKYISISIPLNDLIKPVYLHKNMFYLLVLFFLVTLFF